MARTIKIDNAELKRRSYKRPKRVPKEIVCRILIVCEGEKTEPNYFEAFNKIKRGNVVYSLEMKGGRINTVAVVDKAIALRDAAMIPYDRVWAVFDKDSFPDKYFNCAIDKARAHNIECAWSNEAFELWYLLHFQRRVTPMHRTEYARIISDAVNNSEKYKGRKPYEYRKNDVDNYKIVSIYGNQVNAIDWAEQQANSYSNEKYATHNPCTTVYKLVRQLIGKDEGLNEELKQKVER